VPSIALRYSSLRGVDPASLSLRVLKPLHEHTLSTLRGAGLLQSTDHPENIEHRAADGNEERQLHEPKGLASSLSAIGVACKPLSPLRLELPQASFRFRPIHTLAKLDVPENVLALILCSIQLVVGEVLPLPDETRLKLDPVVSPEMIVHGIPFN
jgi:hypothetical protein